MTDPHPLKNPAAKTSFATGGIIPPWTNARSNGPIPPSPAQQLLDAYSRGEFVIHTRSNHPPLAQALTRITIDLSDQLLHAASTLRNPRPNHKTASTTPRPPYNPTAFFPPLPTPPVVARSAIAFPSKNRP